MTDKIKVASITLVHATGAIDIGEGLANGIIEGTTEQVSTFSEADEVLLRWQNTNPEGHFNKIDWNIRYEDGFERFGTVEIGRARDEVATRPDFVGSTTYTAVRLTSDNPADDGFRSAYDKNGIHRELAIELMAKYDFGLDPAPSSTLKI